MDKESGTLTIADATKDDSGKYICNAHNGHGAPVIKSAFIDVRRRSKRVSPEWQEALLKVYHTVGEESLRKTKCSVNETAKIQKFW